MRDGMPQFRSDDFDVGEDVSTTEQRLRPLTRCERAVLQVLLDPSTDGLTVRERANLADVSITRWYAIIRDPFFKQIQRNMAMDLIGERMRPLINAALASAITEGSKGHADRRMLFEMLGIAGSGYGGRSMPSSVDGPAPVIKAYEDIDDAMILAGHIPHNGNGNGHGENGNGQPRD